MTETESLSYLRNIRDEIEAILVLIEGKNNTIRSLSSEVLYLRKQLSDKNPSK